MRAFRFAAVSVTSVLLWGCLAGPDQSPPNEPDEVGASIQELNGAAAVWTAQGPNAILGGQVENLRDGTEAVGAPSNNVVSGAVHTIIAHPTNANTLWVGTVNGGIWRTNNALTAPPTWVNQTPNLAGLSIGALALDFSQCPGANCGNALAAGTGAQSSAGGISSQLSGIAVTNNGGGAWNLTATQPMANPDVSGLFIQGPVIVVSTRNGGVFRSANTGTTWSAAIAPGTGAAGRRAFDLVRDPSNANRLYLATQGGGGAVAGLEGVFVSNNTGQTWTNVSVNLAALQNAIDAVDAAGNATNTNLELAVGSAGRVYAAVVQNNQPAFIAFSDNQGTNWTQMELPLYPSTTGLAGMVQQVQPSACGVAPCPILITTVMPHNLPTTSPSSTTVQLGVRLTNNMGTAAPANGDFRATIVCNNDPPPANTLPCVNPSTQFVLLGSALAAGSGCGGAAPQPACTGNYAVWNTTSPSLKPGGQGGVHFSIAVHPTNQNIVFVGGDRQNEVRPAGNYIGATVFTGTLWRGNTAVAATLPLQPLPSAQWANLTHNTVCPASPPGCGLPPNPPCCYATPGLPAGTIPGGGTGLGGLGIAGQGSAPHADSREIAFDANNNLIEANDGGLVRRTNPLTSQGDWTSISGNLQITEQHDIAFDAVNRLLVSGNQDTGVSRQIVNCGTPGNPPCTTWTSDNGAGPGQIADGADVVIDDVTLAGAAVPGSIYYTSSQNLGGFVRSTVLSNGAAPTVAPVGLCPAGTAPPGSCAVPAPVLPQFYSPLALNLNNRQQLVIAGQANIWESFTQGRNVQNVGAVNNANAIAYGHPQNANLLVATMPATAAAAGGVFVRTAAFGSGTPDAALAAIALPAAGFNPIDVTVDPAAGPGNVSFFVIGLSAVGAPQLFQFTITSAVGTAVAGNWTNLSGDLAAVNPGVLRRVVYVNAALGGAPNSKFFIAADRGVFVAADPATVATPGGNVFWNEVGANSLPNAPVFDMEYERTGGAANTLFVGTMGRGSWSLPNASTLDLPPIASCRAGVININANAACQGVVAPAAIDNGSLDPDGNPIARTVLPAGPFPLGLSNVTLQVSNAGGVETCTAQINVVDTTGPVITAANTTIPRCAPAPEEVTIPASAVDNCSAPGSVTLTGQLTAVNGVALPTPVAINGSTRRAVLPVGASTIVWNATDALGLPAAAVTQTVTITEADTAAACCGTKTVVEGSALPDLIFLPFPNEYCAFGRGSFDTITGGLAPDLLSGGDGNDFVTGGSTNDVLYGRAGLDILRLPIGGGRVYGGTGSDVIDQSFGGTLYGGPGNDNIDGLFNTNIIYPGSGRDSVEGGPGDDTVIIYDVCELEPLETLDGGLGNDTLITPVSLLELGLRGVIVVGFNNIVVDASNRHLADCF